MGADILPTSPPRLSRLLLVCLALAVAGCAGGDTVPRDPYELSERALFDALDRLNEPVVDSAAVAERSAFAARRMQTAGLMPAFASSFRVEAGGGLDSRGEHVLGYVPGRHPSHADTLVIVAAALEGAAAAAVLETARRLALEALDDVVPERTLLVALWNPSRPPAQGVADFLARPTWGLDRVVRAVVLGDGAAESAGLFEARGIPAEVVPLPETGADREAARALAEQVYGRVRALGFGSAPPALADSLR